MMTECLYRIRQPILDSPDTTSVAILWSFIVQLDNFHINMKGNHLSALPGGSITFYSNLLSPEGEWWFFANICFP